MNARRTRVSVRGVLVLTTAIVSATLLSALPADAHGKKHHGREHGSVVVVHPRGPRRFVVPHHIVRNDAGVYRPYYAGEFYDRGHRHAHVVYHFPVATGAGVVYRPFVYCGDHLLVGVSIPSGAFIDFRWSDGRGGLAVGGSFGGRRFDDPRDDGYWRHPD